MDDFPGLLARDFGLKPQGKATPMASHRNPPAGTFSSFPSAAGLGLGSSASDFTRSSSATRSKTSSMPVFDDHDRDGSADGLLFNDVFGGPPKYASSESRAPPQPSSRPAFDYDNVFKDQKASKFASAPVYDKPVYDEDIFEGISGLKSSLTPASDGYDNVFASIPTSPPKHKKQDSSPFDDLFGNFGRKDAEAKKTQRAREEKKDIPDFDDLIPGFGRSSSPTSNRSMPESNRSHKSAYNTTKTASSVMEDPFVVLESTSAPTVSSSGVFSDPLEEISKLSSTGSRKADRSSVPGGVFDDLDPLDSLGKSVPEINKRGMDTNHTRTGSMNGTQSPVENSESHWQNKGPVDDFMDMPSVSVGQSVSPLHVNHSPNEANSKADITSKSGENSDSSDDVWFTVSEIPLFTQPTSAPPPSKPPPPRPTRPKRSESGSFSSKTARESVNGFSSFANSTQFSYSPSSFRASERSSAVSQLDDLEDFATGRTRTTLKEYPEDSSTEDLESNSVAAGAAMKEAMEKAEAKFRHAREIREREYLKSARAKEGGQSEKGDSQEKERKEKQERLECERQQRQREEEQKEERRLEKEKDREEREREQRRLERERTERERQLARQAVERATREARERAAAEARAKAQKATVEKVAAEARERAERAAVQRAQAEARERAAAKAREKAEKAASEAKERANAEARARAAAQARVNQQKNESDLESFFSMGGSRPSSAPRPRANSSDPVFDTMKQRGPPEAARTSSGASSSMRKASSAANIVDDLSLIFGAAASQSGEFQDVAGESEERRRARLERHQRTQERAAKALAEKNQRDLQVQREQAERHRIAETLDVEIKRWAAGKEGNLRALLSTLQYVLWPECGWQPVSLTDLITAASVKRVYRKATLCIHPDKVQQKGANLKQKYIAEKVFDLLKEAWNKFNSEELF